MSEHQHNKGDFSTTHTTKSIEEERLRERALELEARHHYVVFSQRTAGRQASPTGRREGVTHGKAAASEADKVLCAAIIASAALAELLDRLEEVKPFDHRLWHDLDDARWLINRDLIATQETSYRPPWRVEE